MERSRGFYETVLKQEVALDLGVNVGYKSGLALWQQEYALNVIHGKETEPKSGNTMEVYFESADIDEMYSAVRASGSAFVHEIREQPWGQRVFRFFDPDNFIIEIGEPVDALVRRMSREGMGISEIVKKTTMPEDVVRAILG